MSDLTESFLDAAATTLGALNAALTLSGAGKSFSMWIGAGLVGTVTFEATVDGTNWQGVSLVNGAGALVATVVNPAGDIYSNPQFQSAFGSVRARVSAYTSGSSSARGRTQGR
jgi:hypothetical protein